MQIIQNHQSEEIQSLLHHYEDLWNFFIWLVTKNKPNHMQNC